jgi:undecaprenyl-diphosphatase
MLEYLIKIDIYLFYFIYETLSNPFFDWLMPLFHNPKNWIAPLLILWIYMIIKDKDKRWQLLVLIPLVIILCDQTGRYIKHLELRDRPWAGLDIIALVKQSGMHFSFPSNHSANAVGLAMVISAIYPKVKYYFWGLAFTIMFSRIYIGVHFPADVIIGAIIGLSFGFLLIKYLRPKLN